METVKEIMDVIRKNGPDWFNAFMELSEESSGCTHEQIMETVRFLNHRKEMER